MKQILLIVFFVVGSSSNAQLRVDSIGHTGFGLDSVELYTIDAGTWGNNRYQTYIVNNRHGLYSECFSSDYTSGMGCAIDGFTCVNGLNFSVGVKATAMNKNRVNGGGHAYGLLARAGGAASGYNYAVFGGLSNQSQGAAIFGTVTHNSIGYPTDGCYAGFFIGNVNVTGGLSVVGGTVYMNSVSKSSASTSTSEIFHDSSGNALARLMELTPIEYTYNQEALQELLSPVLDATDSNPIDLKQMEVDGLDKVHYGLPVEELEKIFPNLVYESADGNKYVNYIEMIPVLVQAMKELSDKVSLIEDKVRH